MMKKTNSKEQKTVTLMGLFPVMAEVAEKDAVKIAMEITLQNRCSSKVPLLRKLFISLPKRMYINNIRSLI